VEVFRGDHPFLATSDPSCLLQALALWAVPIPARVVRRSFVPALATHVEMTAIVVLLLRPHVARGTIFEITTADNHPPRAPARLVQRYGVQRRRARAVCNALLADVPAAAASTPAMMIFLSPKVATSSSRPPIAARYR
jgi:hypothetical protein